MNKNYSFEEIEDYLEGNLSKEQVKAFEEDLRRNPELAKTVNEQKQTHYVADMYAQITIKEKIKGIHNRVKKEEKHVSSSPVMKIAAAVALFLCVGLSYIILQTNYSNESMVADNFEAHPNLYQSMGAEESNELSKGLYHYDRQEYSLAINEFTKIGPESPHHIPATFYLAVSYLAVEQAEKAIPIFKRITSSENSFTESSLWYLSLAYLQTDNISKARPLLEKIVKEQLYRYTDAARLLEKLDSPLRNLTM